MLNGFDGVIRREWRRHSVAAVVAMGALFVGIPQDVRAEDSIDVTVLQRGGERIAGRFEDLANGIVFVRQSLHNQRRIPLSSVAVLDFYGNGQDFPPSEVKEAGGPEHVLVGRDGSISKGRLLNIEGGIGSSKGNEPRVVSFRTAYGEERRLRAADVTRIYLGNFALAGAAAGRTAAAAVTTQTSSGAYAVQANKAWNPTGIVVNAGDTVTFRATGVVQLSDNAEDLAGPGGSKTGRAAKNAPLATATAGALVGRIGTLVFGIGDQTQALTMPASGELLLGVNDDGFDDNQGLFNVEIQVTRQPVSRRPR